MQVLKIVGAGLLVVMGVVWALQGLGSAYVPMSFMTNAPEWILIGVVSATPTSVNPASSRRHGYGTPVATKP